MNTQTETRWIVTADDWGFSPLTNGAILAAARERHLTHTSMMANMPFCEEGLLQLANEAPQLGIGLHFTLTSGRPVLPQEEVPLLVDAEGRFCHGFFALWRKAAAPEWQRQIRLELDAQWNRASEILAKVGRTLSHVDSHQHIHAIPGIFPLAAARAEAANIRLRVPVEPFGSVRRFFRRFPHWFPAGLAKRVLLRFCLRRQRSDIVYVGVLDSGQMTASAWRAILQAFQNRAISLEVNLHPATCSDLTAYRDVLECSPGDLRFWSSPARVAEWNAVMEVPICGSHNGIPFSQRVLEPWCEAPTADGKTEISKGVSIDHPQRETCGEQAPHADGTDA